MFMLEKKISAKVSLKVKGTVFLIHTNFLTMKTISLFYCCRKVFIVMNIWMIGKN